MKKNEEKYVKFGSLAFMGSMHDFAKNVKSRYYSKGTRAMYKNMIATFSAN